MEKSLWVSLGKDTKINYEKLKNNIKTEITIIGGGLTGLTTAYYLAKAGKEVTLIEKDKICNHTSGNTTGKITSEHGLFYNYLLQSVGRKEAKHYLEANEQAIKNIAKIIEEEKIECDFEWQDSYVFIQNEKDLEKLKKEQEALEYLSFNSEMVENIQIPIKERNKEDDNTHINIHKKVLGAIKFKNQAQFNAYLYGIGLAEKIKQYGGKIYENSKVIDIKKDEENYEIITEEGKIISKYVVIATHYPIINIPRILFYENVPRNIIFNSSRDKRRII